MKSEQFSKFLFNLSKEPLLVLEKEFKLHDYCPINLSNSNTDIERFDVSSSSQFQDYISNYLKAKNAKIAFGGYLEERQIYKRSPYFNSEIEEERNIHLGLDLWVKAETNIISPLDAEVHSFKNNSNFGDYGPTIILKHVINEDQFYSLYGHLSLQSISNLKVGQTIKQGETFAALGEANINGDYAPHLHVQIIKDLQNNSGDYPGVSSKKNLEFYKNNCPNPNLLLKLG